MLQYNAIQGQSILDIILNTYGTLDLMSKFIQDNGVDNINVVPYSGQSFVWDETLTADQRVNQTSQNSKIIYATSTLVNGNVLSVSRVQPPSGGITVNPTPPQIINQTVIQQYEITRRVEYVCVGGETLIIPIDESANAVLIGASIIQIERDPQPMRASEYTLNKNIGQISFSVTLYPGEVLYIIYTKIINS